MGQERALGTAAQSLHGILLWKQRAQGPGSGMGRTPRAWPFHSWFQRSFLKAFLSGTFGNAALPSWAKLGYTHFHMDRSCQDLPALKAGMLRPGFSSLSQGICFQKALLGCGLLPSGRNSAFPTESILSEQGSKLEG